MKVLQMSLQGAILIAVIIGIRFATRKQMPKWFFIALWWVAAIRLLIPISLPAKTSIYSIIQRLEDAPTRDIENPYITSSMEITGGSLLYQPSLTEETLKKPAKNVWIRDVYLVGAVGCLLALGVLYYLQRKRFREAILCHEPWIQNWKEQHPLKRNFTIKIYDRVRTPLTYGVLSPTIILPAKLNVTDELKTSLILEHEWTHIRRFDASTKMIFLLVTCVHWLILWFGSWCICFKTIWNMLVMRRSYDQ